MTNSQLLEESHRTSNAVLQRIVRQGAALTIVDSPPGGGKTWLVERMLALASNPGGQRVLCVANTNNQARDLVRRVSEFQLPFLRHLVSEAEQGAADPR